jgi:hypothetical protein
MGDKKNLKAGNSQDAMGHLAGTDEAKKVLHITHVRQNLADSYHEFVDEYNKVVNKIQKDWEKARTDIEDTIAKTIREFVDHATPFKKKPLEAGKEDPGTLKEAQKALEENNPDGTNPSKKELHSIQTKWLNVPDTEKYFKDKATRAKEGGFKMQLEQACADLAYVCKKTMFELTSMQKWFSEKQQKMAQEKGQGKGQEKGRH